jgi:hypothetical protein
MIKNILLASLVAASAMAPTWAAGNPAQAQALREFKLDRAHCNSGASQQDRATCLKEASAAYAEARRGALDKEPGDALARNAVQRCDAQPAADRDACIQRIRGAGTSEGSVKGGGVIHRTETTTR